MTNTEWKKEDAIKILKEIANNPDSKDADRVTAIRQLNRIMGYDSKMDNEPNDDWQPTQIIIKSPE